MSSPEYGAVAVYCIEMWYFKFSFKCGVFHFSLYICINNFQWEDNSSTIATFLERNPTFVNVNERIISIRTQHYDKHLLSYKNWKFLWNFAKFKKNQLWNNNIRKMYWIYTIRFQINLRYLWIKLHN